MYSYENLTQKGTISMIKKNEDVRIMKTKKSLKEAFISLLKTTPYQKFTIIDICAKANVHRATFYNYYKSKEDLFISIIEDSNDIFLDTMVQENKCETRIDMINYLVDSFVENFSNITDVTHQILEIQDRNIIKSIFNRSIYLIFYQSLSVFPSANQVIPKDFIATCYAGAFTNIFVWYADNPDVSKEDFSRYVHFFLSNHTNNF